MIETYDNIKNEELAARLAGDKQWELYFEIVGKIYSMDADSPFIIAEVDVAALNNTVEYTGDVISLMNNRIQSAFPDKRIVMVDKNLHLRKMDKKWIMDMRQFLDHAEKRLNETVAK